MPIRVTLVGTGRLATALAAAWGDPARQGHGGSTPVELVAVLGRDPAKATALLAAVPVQSAAEAIPLAAAAGDPARCPESHAVVLAVDDRALPELVAALTPLATRCRLWCHTAGGQGTQVMAPLAAAGSRTGVLHPARPVPGKDPAGLGCLPGSEGTAAALIHGDASARNTLEALCRAAGLLPIWSDGPPDPTRYHAGCALAANGATALAVAAGDAIASGAGLGDRATAELVASLLSGAAAAIRAHPGTWRQGAALSGPAVRGDSTALQRHLEALAGMESPFRSAALRGYRSTMAIAAELAHARGSLDHAAMERILRDLSGEG